jgi:two-component system, cell cycle sensor histidine kinase and response regulator CckA
VRGVTLAIDRHPDCREVILEMTAIPIWDDDREKLIGAVQTLVDRTEPIHKTRELVRAYDELRRLQSRLIQRSRGEALGQLASGAAHALNNFLNALKLRLTLFEKSGDRKHVEAMSSTLRGIGEFTARLQQFSELPPDEEIERTAIGRAVEETLGAMQPELEAAGIEPRVELEATELDVKGDPLALRELLMNLLLTARERMPDGGKLVVGLQPKEASVELSIEDSGAPLSPEQAESLFDPLKYPSPLPRHALLLGVGRAHVQRWGGELVCESRAAGARFVLRLPLARASREPAPRISRPDRRPPTRRLLIVDDDPENARMMAAVLRDEGYDTAVALSGAEARVLWKNNGFDAALLDAVMPDLSGWALARELREVSPDTRIAMVTGADVRGQNRETLALVDAIFGKPVDIGALDEFLSR